MSDVSRTAPFFTSVLRRPGPYPRPSAEVEAEMRSALKQAFGIQTGQYGLYCMSCPAGDNIGALVRLAFHDR